MRFAVLLAVAVPLAIADLVHKASAETQWWAYHERSLGWIALCVVLFVAILALVRVPSATIPPAAGLLAAGVLGNMMSAAWNDLRVPNPIVVEGNRAILAFNLADIWALAGIVLLMISLSVWLIRNRELLPPPHDAWSPARWRGRR
jgi:lipoprotein signal peptidase